MTISRNERQAIAILLRCVGGLGIRVMLVGAAARRLLLEGVHNRPGGRATTDWDWGVWVRDWAELETLHTCLLSNPGRGFEKTSVEHRLDYNGVLIDLVPFGPIAGDERSIVWPDSQNTMSVLGFDEALASVKYFDQGGVTLPIVSIPALSLLKIISYWSDGVRRQRDLVDFLYILGNYSEVVEPRMWDEVADQLSDGSLNFDSAGPLILGCEVRELSGDSSLSAAQEAIHNVLTDSERHLVPLLRVSLSEEDQRGQLQLWVSQLEAFRSGLG